MVTVWFWHCCAPAYLPCFLGIWMMNASVVILVFMNHHLWSPFTQSSMSCKAFAPKLAASAWKTRMSKSPHKMVCTEPMLILTSFTSSWMVTRWICIIFTWSVTLHLDLLRIYQTNFTLRWYVDMTEAIVLLLYSCDAHGIVSKGLLNLVNGFNMDIKHLTKLGAIQLLKSFRHFAAHENPKGIHCIDSQIDFQKLKISVVEKKMNTCMSRSSKHPHHTTPFVRHWFLYIEYF